MVKGLNHLRDHLVEHADRYVLIGGTASHLALREEGLDWHLGPWATY